MRDYFEIWSPWCVADVGFADIPSKPTWLLPQGSLQFPSRKASTSNGKTFLKTFLDAQGHIE